MLCIPGIVPLNMDQFVILSNTTYVVYSSIMEPEVSFMFFGLTSLKFVVSEKL